MRNLRRGQEEWPLSLVTEVYVFGSFARGALSPHDLEIDVEHGNDDKWCAHFVTSLACGRDPDAPMRRLPAAGKRGCQLAGNVFSSLGSRAPYGVMFWLMWKRLLGSYFRLT